MIGQSGFHRAWNPQGLMDSNEIAIHGMHRRRLFENALVKRRPWRANTATAPVKGSRRDHWADWESQSSISQQIVLAHPLWAKS